MRHWLVTVAVLVCAILGPLGAAPIAGQSTCSAEIQVTNAKPFTGLDRFTVNLFSTVSKPAGMCMPAEIRLLAAFYDAEQDVVCSGVIESAALQNSNMQSTDLEIRPATSWNSCG